MVKRPKDEFRRDPVRIAISSGLTRPQVSSDLGVGLSTLNKWIQQLQRDDMALLAHFREQQHFSLQSYGRPSMTEELQDLELNVGHRRVGRLRGENGVKIIRTQI